MKIIAVITTKDRTELFAKAVETAALQSRKPDDLIVVSDSGEENIGIEESICEKYGAILIKDAYAHNYAGSLNTAIHKIISGRLFNARDFSDIYIAFLDDDDYWDACYLEKCEDSLKNGEDFVISGINYIKDGVIKKLSIPQKVQMDDFLAGNPHIQGSNTFIKLETLLKAGLFDENIPSPTDRDLFVRVMMSNPSYTTVNEWLVNVNISEDRERITTSREKKINGFKKFYYKYGGLMNGGIKDAFFERIERLFNIDKSCIEPASATPYPASYKSLTYSGKYTGALTAGFIATEYESGLRLLKQLIALNRENVKIIIFINFLNNTLEYENILNKSGCGYCLITHDKILVDYKRNRFAGLASEDQIKKFPVHDIAVSRTMLQYYLYEQSNDGGVVWVIDDDMELADLIPEPDGFKRRGIDIDGVIAEYRGEYDAVTGNYALDAPLPVLSTLRTSLLDYAYSKINAVSNPVFNRLIGDYYYDLTDESNIHLETPVKMPDGLNNPLDIIFSGKAAARPLYATNGGVKEVKSRGGNTFIFNRELLKIPNWSLRVNDKTGRRSDYFWVLLAKERGYRLANVPFALTHNRAAENGMTGFNYKKEENKFLLDLIGSSFTKAVEEAGFSSGRRDFFYKYKSAFTRRLVKYTASYYRIMGLLDVIGGECSCSQDFTAERFLEFLKTAESYLHYESVISAFNILHGKLYIQSKMQSRGVIEEEIKNIFYTDDLVLLGFGNEGIVYHDSQFVYKWFFKRPDNLEFMKKLNFGGCEHLYRIDIYDTGEKCVIRYKYEQSEAYNGGYTEQLADLISFAKSNNFIISNIKKSNFIIVNNTLKMIDYGHSIEPYNEKKYQRSVMRCYEMLRYYFLTEDEFKCLITEHYNVKKAGAIDYGYENFELLVQKRTKEIIHDTEIIELLKHERNFKILDFGAGKCKLANVLSRDHDVTAYDIDAETLKNYGGKHLKITDNLDSLEPNSFDIVLNNLVLCVTSNEENGKITDNITKFLKPGGRAIISFCSPFFNSVERTELRTNGYGSHYNSVSIFEKKTRGEMVVKREYHRPVEYYKNLLNRRGYRINNIIECNGADTQTLLPVAEHLILDCELVKKDTLLADCSLLIKTNPMEYRDIYASIRHITCQLEKETRFFERIAVVDSFPKKERSRRYSDDNLQMLFSELERAKESGLIDRVITADNEREISRIYKKYFDIEANDPHAANGQGLFATLTGFESVKTPVVFQTDSDIIFHNNNPCEFMSALRLARNGAVTVSLSIAHRENLEEKICNRVEVRNCFVNLEQLGKLLPLANISEDGIVQLPWHRALDKKTDAIASANIRMHSKDLFFIHPENSLKNIENLIAYARQSAEKNRIAESQFDSVNLAGTPEEWLIKTEASVILYIRGYNTPNGKIKRLFDSLKKQTYQDYFIIYADDASQNGSADYAEFILGYDVFFRGKSYCLLNGNRMNELANFVTVMKNIAVNPRAVIINIDNDDCLASGTAIERIVYEFERGAEITCGNCLRYDRPLRNYRVYSFDKVWKRGGDNIWLHPKCFRRRLFDFIDIGNDLKIDGKFADVNTDFAFMLPMIEHSSKCVFIEDLLYYFEPSADNINSTGKHKKEYKEEMRQKLLEKARRRYEENHCGNRRRND